MVAELRRGQLALMAVSKKVSLLRHLYFSEKRPSRILVMKLVWFMVHLVSDDAPMIMAPYMEFAAQKC